MSITYYVHDNAAPQYAAEREHGLALKATDDESARIEAATVAAENGFKEPYLSFFRSTDQCRGVIDL